MAGLYADTHRALQKQFNTIRKADYLEQSMETVFSDPDKKAFIGSRDLLLYATSNADGFPVPGYQSGPPGFIKIADERTLLFPVADGNQALANIRTHTPIGMLFISFDPPHRLRLHGTADLVREGALIEPYESASSLVRVQLAEAFVNCPRYIHPHQKLAALANRDQPASQSSDPSISSADMLSEAQQAFIAEKDMFFLATDGGSKPTISHKGGDPGYVKVMDERTIAFPNYEGNGMYLSMGNIGLNPKIGLLFMNLETTRSLLLLGRARLEPNHPLMASYTGAQFIAVVSIAQIIPDSVVHQYHYRLLERSCYVPRTGSQLPFPGWKRLEEFQHTLTEEETRAAQAAGVIDREQYKKEEKQRYRDSLKKRRS